MLTRNLRVGVYAMNDVEQWYAPVSAVWVIINAFVDEMFRQGFHASGSMTPSAFY